MPTPFSDPKYDLDDMSIYATAVLATTEAVSQREHGKAFEPEQISPAEVQLATWLTKRGLTGYVQQSPIGPYAADFHWPHLGLVVEIDGKHHDRHRDEKRDAYLLANGRHLTTRDNALGFRVWALPTTELQQPEESPGKAGLRGNPATRVAGQRASLVSCETRSTTTPHASPMCSSPSSPTTRPSLLTGSRRAASTSTEPTGRPRASRR